MIISFGRRWKVTLEGFEGTDYGSETLAYRSSQRCDSICASFIVCSTLIRFMSETVGCVSINPANPGLAATAHLKRDMRIWDLAALRGCDQESTYDVIMEQAMIVAYPHDKACSSAYFDPSGTRLLSTSYDDCLRGESLLLLFLLSERLTPLSKSCRVVWDVDPHAIDRPMFQKEPAFEPTEIFSHNCQGSLLFLISLLHLAQC